MRRRGRRRIDDRLVVQLEVAVLDRDPNSPSSCSRLRPVTRADSSKNSQRPGTAVLRVIHRGVAFPDQLVRVGTVRQRDPDTRGHAQIDLSEWTAGVIAATSRVAITTAAARSSTSSQRTTNSSPPSRPTVSLLERPAPAVSQFDEHLVADLMAEAVVDELQSIQVDEEQRDVGFGTVGPVEGERKAVDHECSIRQAGERIVQRRSRRRLRDRLRLQPGSCSRSSRFVSRSIVAVSTSAIVTEPADEIAALAPGACSGAARSHVLVEVGGCPVDESFGEEAEPSCRAVADYKRVLTVIREVEDRDVGVRIQLSHLGMDDVVEGQQERHRRVVADEEGRVGRVRAVATPSHRTAKLWF